LLAAGKDRVYVSVGGHLLLSQTGSSDLSINRRVLGGDFLLPPGASIMPVLKAPE
jgi:hypothetical protein